VLLAITQYHQQLLGCCLLRDVRLLIASTAMGPSFLSGQAACGVCPACAYSLTHVPCCCCAADFFGTYYRVIQQYVSVQPCHALTAPVAHHMTLGTSSKAWPQLRAADVGLIPAVHIRVAQCCICQSDTSTDSCQTNFRAYLPACATRQVEQQMYPSTPSPVCSTASE
jgi:hypothetical protein